MHVARLLFGVASRSATGTVEIRTGEPPGERVLVEIERGWVHAIAALGLRSGRPEDALRDVLRRTPARARFLADERATRIGRCTPFHPAAVLRNHVEGLLGEEAGASARRRAGGRALRLVYAPHPSCLGHDERPLVARLDLGARTFADLDAMGVAPPRRVDRLVGFLESVGSVTVEGAAESDGVEASPLELLGAADGATPDEIRRAYKRLARALHPDLRHDLPESERRRLEARFVELTAAYRRLIGDE